MQAHIKSFVYVLRTGSTITKEEIVVVLYIIDKPTAAAAVVVVTASVTIINCLRRNLKVSLN